MARNREVPQIGIADRNEKLKRLALIAMFSDDDLMERLVLKGGNALDIVYKVSSRASNDIDLSMEGQFDESEIDVTIEKFKNCLTRTFKPEGYSVFEVTLAVKPPEISADLASFWGGYLLQFKVIESAKAAELDSLDALRRNAVLVGDRGKFQVDISKFEFCSGKVGYDIEGFQVFAYTPEMIACEKLRAICQQMPEYTRELKKHQTARARDFVDIYTVISHYKIDLTTPENHSLMTSIFSAKRVPVTLVSEIQNTREFHRPDFESVLATVKPGAKLRDFDFYFNFVVDLATKIESLWDV